MNFEAQILEYELKLRCILISIVVCLCDPFYHSSLDQLLDVEMQKQKQFWNQGAKRSPNPTTSHILFTYWSYQVGFLISHPYLMVQGIQRVTKRC